VQELVEYIVRPLVDHPDDVVVSTIEGDSSVLLELRVNAADVGKVRGPKGRRFQDIQQVLAIAGGDRKPVLELIDSEDGAEE
jgi:predicted RNA-binding protein YlqC (UPF0109 family)